MRAEARDRQHPTALDIALAWPKSWGRVDDSGGIALRTVNGLGRERLLHHWGFLVSDAPTHSIVEGQIADANGISLLGRSAKPLDCVFLVRAYSATFRVRDSDLILSITSPARAFSNNPTKDLDCSTAVIARITVERAKATIRLAKKILEILRTHIT